MKAPIAPGQLGVAPDGRELYQYLSLVTEWLQTSRRELDALDAEILSRNEDFTGDMMLAMTLWQDSNNRVQRILSHWDSGRADLAARTKISSLIWGTESGKSLPETGQLLDLVTDKIRNKLGLESGTSDHLVRLNKLKAQFERVGESIEALETNHEIWTKLASFHDRLTGLRTQRERGADISGPLTSLESDAALLERDAIMATAIGSSGGPPPPDPRIVLYQRLGTWIDDLAHVPGTPQPLLDQSRELLEAVKNWINR